MYCGIHTNRKWNYVHVSVLPFIFVSCSLTIEEVGRHSFPLKQLFYFISFYLILFYFISFIFTFHFILFYFLFYFIFMLCGIPTLIGLDQWKYLFLFLKKNATSEHCILNIIIIFFFWLIIISEIGSNGQCSKIVNFNRTEAGLISKWARISPAVQWCYQNQSNCTLWRCTASHEIENFNLFLF